MLLPIQAPNILLVNRLIIHCLQMMKYFTNSDYCISDDPTVSIKAEPHQLHHIKPCSPEPVPHLPPPRLPGNQLMTSDHVIPPRTIPLVSRDSKDRVFQELVQVPPGCDNFSQIFPDGSFTESQFGESKFHVRKLQNNHM